MLILDGHLTISTVTIQKELNVSFFSRLEVFLVKEFKLSLNSIRDLLLGQSIGEDGARAIHNKVIFILIVAIADIGSVPNRIHIFQDSVKGEIGIPIVSVDRFQSDLVIQITHFVDDAIENLGLGFDLLQLILVLNMPF